MFDDVLETDRLRLRPYREDDLDALATMFADPVHMRWYPATFSRADTQAWVDRQLERYRNDGFGLWIAEERDGAGFVGTVGPVRQEVEGRSEVEIGWHVRPGLKGRGYAVEGATAARSWAFERLEVNHVIALIRPQNEPSRRVAEKLGMHVDREVDFKGLLHLVYRSDRAEATIEP